MKIFSQPLGASGTALTAGVVTEGNLTLVDLGASAITREFSASLRVVENATAPGGSRTITVNYYWSDYDLTSVATDAERILQLVDRKNNFTAVTRRNTASSTRYFSLVSATTNAGLYLRPLARYLYISITKTTEDSGSIPTATLNLVRVMAQTSTAIP